MTTTQSNQSCRSQRSRRYRGAADAVVLRIDNPDLGTHYVRLVYFSFDRLEINWIKRANSRLTFEVVAKDVLPFSEYPEARRVFERGGWVILEIVAAVQLARIRRAVNDLVAEGLLVQEEGDRYGLTEAGIAKAEAMGLLPVQENNRDQE